VSGRKFKRTNIVATKCGDAVVAPMIYEGTTDSILFEQCLLKAIPKHSVIILDNATFHRKAQLRKLTADADCEIIFLPAPLTS
jgi:transposase